MGGQPKVHTGVEALWAEYQAARSIDVRNLLVLHYVGLVKWVTARMITKVPASTDREDIAQDGILGLLDAIERFDPGRGFTFQTFATKRIEGAIWDENRGRDWAPRSVRQHARGIDRALAKLEGALGRAPTDDEVAGELGFERRKYDTIVADIWRASISALEAHLWSGSDRDDRSAPHDTLVDLSAPDPLAQLEADDDRTRLVESLNLLPDRLRKVIVLHYLELMTLAAIGDILRVSESRVCQLHRQAVGMLRDQLLDRAPQAPGGRRARIAAA
jgi:RNA polymerase sigma factor for flagellar operon FliA